MTLSHSQFDLDFCNITFEIYMTLLYEIHKAVLWCLVEKISMTVNVKNFFFCMATMY